MAKPKSFFTLLTEAINHFIENGYTSQKELDFWTRTLQEGIVRTLGPLSSIETKARKSLKNTYGKLVVHGGLLRQNKGVSKYSIEMLKPKMRRDLDRRILASANLIKLNRKEAVAITLRRFQGWATSIPKGGSRALDLKKAKASIRKPLRKVTFQEKRVIIDQSQKFAASLNAVIAEGNSAIAAVWHSRWKTAGYDYRKDHKERDNLVYTIRDNWALRQGLMKVGASGYTDEITQPAEEVYCQCRYTYIYSIDALPDSMLTEKGRQLLAQAKAKISSR